MRLMIMIAAALWLTMGSAGASLLNPLGERFTRLALALGEHDGDYVDAYYGPDAWRRAAKAEALSLAAVEAAAAALADDLAAATAPEGQAQRLIFLQKRVRAMRARIDILQGDYLPFDAETRAIYDAVAPRYEVAGFDAALAALDDLLPGDGPLPERAQAFRARYEIPADKLAAVFDAALAECRRHTRLHYDLPDTESFRVGYVTDKPWGGYNYYQGDFASIIEINTDFPTDIGRAVDLGCHEGYPGHHVFGALREQKFVRGLGWPEFLVNPLFEPSGPLAEGSANFGIDLAFPGEEKVAFEAATLYPLAGLDPATAPAHAAYAKAQRALAGAGIHFARLYLDGEIDKEAFIEASMRYSLRSRARAEQRLRFVEKYRSYVINYVIGLDRVEEHIDVVGGDDPARRWAAFRDILVRPVTLEDLARR